jgi:hypothetical protein
LQHIELAPKEFLGTLIVAGIFAEEPEKADGVRSLEAVQTETLFCRAQQAIG